MLGPDHRPRRPAPKEESDEPETPRHVDPPSEARRDDTLQWAGFLVGNVVMAVVGTVVALIVITIIVGLADGH